HDLRVSVDEPVVRNVKLRDQRLEAVLARKEMQMCRAHIVAALRAQKLAGRAIDRNGVARGLHAAKADVAVLVREELPAQVHVRLDRKLFVRSGLHGLVNQRLTGGVDGSFEEIGGWIGDVGAAGYIDCAKPIFVCCQTSTAITKERELRG